MSSSSSALEVSAFGHLLGGLPSSEDFVPSIVFAIAFALVLPLAIWRIALKSSRTWVLIRPLIYIVVRIVTWIIRAIEANGTLSENLFIAEQVLLSAGTIMLVEPLVALTTQLLEACIPNTGGVAYDRKGNARRQDRVGLVGRVLRLAMVAALAITIYSSASTANAFTDPNTAATLVTLRKVVGALLVAAVGISVLSVLYFSTLHEVPGAPMRYLVLIGVFLMVAAAYRLANALGAAGVQEKVAFYLGLVLPEFIATILFFAVNMNTLMPKPAPSTRQQQTNGQYPMDQRQQAYPEQTV